jgi:general secretion pathway protein B
MPAPIETAPRSTAPAAFRSPQSDAPLAVADLDAGARQQLPPLKLSMHVWNEAPAQRFVILDGQRLREGDVIGEVVVERITRDGAQLSWRGTALKLEWR